MKSYLKPLPGLCLLLSSLEVLGANPLEEWSWRNPLPQGNDLAGISFIDGRFVAVGAGGTIQLSLDGVTWTAANTPTRNELAAVTGGEGTMLAVGAAGTILKSTDGRSWTLQPSTTTNDLYSVAYGNGRFVASHYRGVVVVYTDGRSPTNVPVPETEGLGYHSSCLVFGNGTFVLGGEQYRLVSEDGLTWSASDYGDWTYLEMELVPRYLYMTYSAGAFWASSPVAYLTHSPSGFPFVSRSLDGKTWTSSAFLEPYGPYAPTFGEGLYVGTDRDANVMTSTDGLNWSLAGTAFPFHSSALAFGNGTFVAVGANGATATSSGGKIWVQHSTSPAGVSRLAGFASYGDRSVLVGGDYLKEAVAFTSANGVDFAKGIVPGGIPALNAAARDSAGKFIAVGDGGAVLSSDDGVTWANPNSATSGHLYGIAGNGRFVAVGYNGTITTSTDGSAWGVRPSPTASDLRGIAYGNGTWVAVGMQGSVFTSTDSGVWDAQNSSTAADLYGVDYADGMFVICGDKGTILASPNGTSWTRQASGTDSPLLSVRHAHGMWLAVGSNGTILSSTDAVRWTLRSCPTAYQLEGIGFNYGSFLVLGSRGVVLESGDLNVPYILGCHRTPQGAFALSFTGPVGAVCRLQAAPSLVSSTWTELTTFTNVTGTTNLQDTTAAAEQARFYRVNLP